MGRLNVALLQLRAWDLHQHASAWRDVLARIDEAAALEPRPQLIVTPECSYPAYFLHSREAYEAAGVLPDSEVEGTLGERARRHGCYIAAGLVRRAAGGRLENAAVLFGPDGAVLGRHAKTFLWHFDRTWFEPGSAFPVFDVGDARAGMLVCADARLPEVARALAVGGASVIIDCTAWVSWGRDASALGTPQADYLMPARCIENGAWAVVADKVGVEADSLVYAGRSGVIDPRGEWVVQAPSDRPGIVVHTLDLDAAHGAPVPRRPELYAGAALAGEHSRAAALAREPLVADDASARVAAIALDAAPSAVELLERVRALVRALAAQDVVLAVLPDFAGTDPRALTHLEVMPALEALNAETGVALAVVLAERDGARTYKTAYLLDGGRPAAAHRQTHLRPAEAAAGFAAGEVPAEVVATRAGNVALVAASEGLVPEVARGLKLAGAEVLAWSAGSIGPPLRVLARARANENRAYVAAAGGSAEDGGAYVVDPAGGVAAESLAGRQMAVSADINRLFARWHSMAPGTDPVLGRPVEAFASLWGPTPHLDVARASEVGAAGG